jgi:uridylate kinase
MATGEPYRRVVLKLSGEALCASGGCGIDPEAIERLAGELKAAHEVGSQIGLVVGGGNFLRGRTLAAEWLDRAVADSMGMLATVMNALALAEALKAAGVDAVATSAVPVGPVCETIRRERVIEHLEAGRVVLLGGGTGQPFFTTDSGAALRACQIGADAVLKATKVDGVFDSDPVAHPDARRFDRLSYGDVLARRLGVMDLAAVSLCMEAAIPVIVFNMTRPGALAAAVRGESVGTVISVE